MALEANYIELWMDGDNLVLSTLVIPICNDVSDIM